MKNLVLHLSIFVLALTACQQNNTEPVDIAAEEAAVDALLTRLTTAFKDQDVTTLTALLHENVLFLGSDPSEIWDKEKITAIWTQMLSQPFELKMAGDPEISIAPDGHSAVAVQQYYMPAFSTKLQFRNGYHLIKVNDNWLIFASNTACIPKNEDLPKINEAIAK